MIVTPHVQNISYRERTLCPDISANVSYEISCDQEWVSAVKDKDDRLFLHVASNDDIASRTATVSFTNAEHGITQTMEIVQDAHVSVIDVWPDGAPTSNGLSGEEQVAGTGNVSNVSVPTITVYHPKAPNGMAVVMCPGGGYTNLAMKHEGHDMAAWFCSQGITYAVLKYRMPNGHSEVPLDDASEAVRIVRRNAGDWQVDVRKVGIMGASAGGHLAASLATHGTGEARPDFQVLLYPVITMGTGTHAGSRNALLGNSPTEAEIEEWSCEDQVTADTPPAFIAYSANDDVVSTVNSTNYKAALEAAGVPCEVHVYPTGGHGWGFKDSFAYKSQWTAALELWLSKFKPAE